MPTDRIWKALTTNSAQTDANSEDPRLKGRTYLVPFAIVWDEIINMIESHPRWTLIHADEASGSVRAEARTLVFRFTDDVQFKLKLDDNALTRVDMSSSSRVGRADLGMNARRISRFFRQLDRRLAAAE